PELQGEADRGDGQERGGHQPEPQGGEEDRHSWPTPGSARAPRAPRLPGGEWETWAAAGHMERVVIRRRPATALRSSCRRRSRYYSRCTYPPGRCPSSRGNCRSWWARQVLRT